MQNIIIDKPYRFIPPVHSRLWPRLIKPFLPWYLDRRYGITHVNYLGLEHLDASIAAGHGILLTPNHCRDADPPLMGLLGCRINHFVFLMASWHVFMQSPLMRFIANRGGGFSIYREGMDRAAIDTAIDILESAERPLVIFPEGAISHTNDRLNALQEGTALIARSAAKRRAKRNPPGKVVVHPVGLRYRFMGNLQQSLGPVLDAIEHRLSWQPQRNLPLVDRVAKIGRALLCLKEVEYLGEVQPGPIDLRITRLIDHLLAPLEAEWLAGRREDTVIGRVKRLRIAILPDLVKGDITEAERQRRWRQLADIYLAQQLSNYPPDYIAQDPTPDRLLETVEHFEEDLTDTYTVHRPLHATISIAPAIEVAPDRAEGLMQQIEEGIKQMLRQSRSPS